MLADGVKALVAAVMVDKGPNKAYSLVRELVTPRLGTLDVGDLLQFKHPKVVLKATLGEKSMPPPEYKLLNESGRLSHSPTFHVGVFAGDQCLGEGWFFCLLVCFC